MKDRGHARFSPSGSSIWIYCPGSIPFVESLKLQPWTSDAAELGTAVHTLLEMSLKKGVSPHSFIGKRVHENYKVDRTMANGAEIAADVIRPIFERSIAHGTEQQLDIPATGQWGTVDAWALEEDIYQLLLHVFDYKNGRVFVSAKKNPQLRIYANGVYAHTQKHHKGKKLAMRLHIIQPNTFQEVDPEDRAWATNSVAEQKWTEEMVVPAVKAIKAGTARRVPGNHCLRCRGAGRCPELAAAALKTARMDWGVG